MKQNLLELLKKQARDFKKLADEVVSFEPPEVGMVKNRISSSRLVVYEEFKGLEKRVAMLETRLSRRA